MANGTVRAVLLGAILVTLFASTSMLTGAYRAARHSRGLALFGEGEALAGSGQAEAAASRLREALSLEPNQAAYRAALAKALLDGGSWAEAESHLEELSEDDPTDGDVNLMLARVAAHDGRDADAVTLYQRAIYGHWLPKSAGRTQARWELVDLLTRAGRGKQAVAELLQLASDPGADAATRSRAGNVLLERGDARDAADVFGQLAAEHPHDGDIWTALANAKFAAGDFAAARDAYTTALRWDSSDRPPLVRRLAVTNTVIALDPSEVRLSAAQRHGRMRALAERVLALVERCAGGADRLAGEAATLAASTRQWLARPRPQEGDTPEALRLLEDLWRAAQPLCRGQKPDEAAAALMARLAK